MLINLELPQPPTFHTLQILRKKKKKNLILNFHAYINILILLIHQKSQENFFTVPIFLQLKEDMANSSDGAKGDMLW